MLTRVTGNTGGIFKDVAAMVNAGSKNGRRLELYDGTRYQVSSTNDGDGVLLSTGNFANPITEDPVDSTQYVIPQTVSGELVAGGEINQIRDSGAFNLPLANSVLVNAILVVELPNIYKNETPVITVSGADTVTNNSGADTSISFVGEARLTLTSDGVSNWSL